MQPAPCSRTRHPTGACLAAGTWHTRRLRIATLSAPRGRGTTLGVGNPQEPRGAGHEAPPCDTGDCDEGAIPAAGLRRRDSGSCGRVSCCSGVVDLYPANPLALVLRGHHGCHRLRWPRARPPRHCSVLDCHGVLLHGSDGELRCPAERRPPPGRLLLCGAPHEFAGVRPAPGGATTTAGAGERA